MVACAMMDMINLRITFLALGGIVAGLSTAAAASVEVEYKKQYHPVVDVKRNTPIIEVEGKRRSITTSQIRVNREGGTVHKEGYFILKDRQISTKNLGPKVGARFNKI